MDNHPIPQDVTGFQFRLIGDMTVKQFAFVAAGCVVGFVIFYLPLSPFIKIPLGILPALFGAALAFLPIEGRPADVMVSNFLKALFTPNQYAYHKIGGALHIFSLNLQSTSQLHAIGLQPTNTTPAQHDPAKKKRLTSYLASLHQQSATALDQKEMQFLQQITTYQPQIQPQPLVAPVASSQQPQPLSPPPSDTNKDDKKQAAPQAQPEASTQQNMQPIKSSTQPTDLIASSDAVSDKAQAQIEQALKEAREEESGEKDERKLKEAHAKVADLEVELKNVQSQKAKLEQELTLLKAEKALQQAQVVANQEALPAQQVVTQSPQPSPALSTQQQTPAAAWGAAPSEQKPTEQNKPSIRQISAEVAKSIGLPHLPDIPNLIIGIIKDPRGNVLSNILVEVKDQDGTPARAFRTNTLGQFASATPLASGSYTITFEDSKNQHRFDTVELIAKGEILLPLEIISHDEREDLRKELFS